MTLINKLENAIKELEGGRFQKLCDSYLRKKYDFKIVSLGSQEGTDKTTKGIPDSYAEEDDKYVYIMYGTHKPVISKLKEDIRSVKKKILEESIAEDKVGRLICCHTSSNITIEQKEELEKIFEPYRLELIGINELAYDLTKLNFQYLAKEYLSISESTEQVWALDDFIRIHDMSKTNAPISNDYIGDVKKYINNMESSENRILLISSKSGTGKTRLAIEICSLLDRNKYNILCVKSNNQDIYQDVKCYLSLDKENIIFIDDVNTTQNYISTLGLLNTNSNIRFILTVRDYAKKDIINNIKDYGYDNFVPTLLKDDNFKQLLNQFSQKDFTNKEIEHIKTISKSNPRIAVIAAKLSSSQDLTNFNDEIDILNDYYEEILDKNNIIYSEQKSLFILSYLKKIRLDNLESNKEFNKLLKIIDITNTDFKSGVEKLHERELCNIYNDKIVKIADQSLDDYIVIKFLINKKISILEILHELYPVNDQRVVQILNQCSNFIRSKDDLESISDAVRTYYAKSNFENDELKEKFLIQCVFDDYMISERQDIYINLTNHNHAWFYKDNVEIRLQQIADSYSNNWQNIFNFANQFKHTLFMNDNNIELVLFNMFLLLKNDNKIKFLNAMFKSNYHFENRKPISFSENIEKHSMRYVIASSPESEKYEWQLAYLTQLENVKNEDLQTLKSILEVNSLPSYFTILNFERLILKDSGLTELLIQKARNSNFVISDFIREEEVPKLINLIGENSLKFLYLKNLGNNMDQACILFQKLGEDDIDFAVEILKKIDELKMGHSDLEYMILHAIDGFRDKNEIYKKYIHFAINRPSYCYNSMLEDIIKIDTQIIIEMLEETKDEKFVIRLVNLGVEVLENNNQKLKLFKFIKSKGFGKKSFQEIHFSPSSHFFTGSHVPVLELEKEFLENIKEIFEADIDYIELLLYLDKLIDVKRKGIERELEKEF